MPKHSLSFKHLVGEAYTRNNDTPQTQQQRSVNDLLSSSRQATPRRNPVARTSTQPQGGPSGRDRPPHLGSRDAWTATADIATEAEGGGDVHPAELLRRERVAAARAARSVAGPAPPRSWRPATSEQAGAEKKGDGAERWVCKEPTRELLLEAAAFLETPPRGRGAATTTSTVATKPKTSAVPSLVDCCVDVILRSLHDATVVDFEVDDEGHNTGLAVTMEDAVLAGAIQLSIPLRARLLHRASLLPPEDQNRLSDRHLRALLEYSHDSTPRHQHESDDDDDWDASSTASTHAVGLTTLALTCHPAPLPILRDLPRARFGALSALTTLNLAFATLPMHLDGVVAALPPGLRALGLAGVRTPREVAAPGWVRGLDHLGRRMLVLQTLDLSYTPIPDVRRAVSELLGVGKRAQGGAAGETQTHLPSVRVLGLRGTAESESERRHIKEVVNGSGGGKRHWVDVVF